MWRSGRCGPRQRRYPGNHYVNYNLARCLALTNPPQLDEAIRFYTAAIAARPDDTQAYTNISELLYAKGRLDDAIASSKEAIRLQPNDEKARSNLCSNLREKGELDEAIANGREAVRINPREPAYRYFLGIALFEKGETWTRRSPRFEESVRLRSDVYMAHFDLGRACSRRVSWTRPSPA